MEQVINLKNQSQNPSKVIFISYCIFIPLTPVQKHTDVLMYNAYTFVWAKVFTVNFQKSEQSATRKLAKSYSNSC